MNPTDQPQLNPDIQQRVQQAIAAGANPQEAYQRGVARQQAESAQTPAPAPSEDILSQIGGGAVNIGKNLLDPFVGTGKAIVGAGVQTPLMLAQAAAAQTGHQGTAVALEKARQAVAPVGMSDQDFQDVSQNPEKAMREQLGRSLQVASYAIPYGQGAGVVTKALLPGAAQGAAYEMGRENAQNEPLNTDRIVGSGVVGGAGATALYGAGKAYNALKGSGDTLQNASDAIDQGTRQIKVKPSVYGAGKEDTINQTLDTLGIKGSAQSQYEQLQPKMQELGDKISTELTQNPKVVSYAQIRDDFLKNAKDITLTGDMTNKQAQTTFDSYIRDLSEATTGKGLGDDITTPDLFAIKQKVNNLYGPIADKLERGGALTPREAITASLRTTLDDAIANAHPDIKEATQMQSNLYDAARSLSAARANPPTFRMMGTSVPASVTQKARDLASGALNTTGGAFQALPPISPTLAGAAGAQAPKFLTPGSVTNTTPNPTNPQQNVEPQNKPQQGNHTPISISQGVNQDQYITGHSPVEHYQAYQKALAAGNTKAANQIRQFYNDEIAHQKEVGVKKLSGQQLTQYTSAKSALSLTDQVEKAFQLTNPGAIGPFSRITGYGKEAAGASGLDKQAYTYNSFINGLKVPIAKALGNVGQLNANEQKDALNLLPAVGDTKEEAAIKLARLRSIFQDRISTIEQVQQNQAAPATQLPDITSAGASQ